VNDTGGVEIPPTGGGVGVGVGAGLSSLLHDIITVARKKIPTSILDSLIVSADF